MFVDETLMKRGCLWQWGLVVHVLPRFLLKSHFSIICVQLQQKHVQLQQRNLMTL